MPNFTINRCGRESKRVLHIGLAVYLMGVANCVLSCRASEQLPLDELFIRILVAIFPGMLGIFALFAAFPSQFPWALEFFHGIFLIPHRERRIEQRLLAEIHGIAQNLADIPIDISADIQRIQASFNSLRVLTDEQVARLEPRLSDVEREEYSCAIGFDLLRCPVQIVSHVRQDALYYEADSLLSWCETRNHQFLPLIVPATRQVFRLEDIQFSQDAANGLVGLWNQHFPQEALESYPRAVEAPPESQGPRF